MQWDTAFSENTLQLGHSVLQQAQEEEGAALPTKAKSGASRVSGSIAQEQGRASGSQRIPRLLNVRHRRSHLSFAGGWCFAGS